MTDINGIFSVCEAVGTAAFAVSGAMVAVDKGTDIFGVLLMAVFTALGGGTLRDMLIGYFPPRMFTNFHYVLLACLCAIIVFAIARTFKERYVARERMIEQINNVFDAIGRLRAIYPSLMTLDYDNARTPAAGAVATPAAIPQRPPLDLLDALSLPQNNHPLSAAPLSFAQHLLEATPDAQPRPRFT